MANNRDPDNIIEMDKLSSTRGRSEADADSVVSRRDPEQSSIIPQAVQPRPTLATFSRRQVQMLPICITRCVEAKLILVGKMIGYCLLYQSGQELAIGGGLNLFVSFLLAGTVLYALQV